MQILRIDMEKEMIRTENCPEKYSALGGRGLTSVLINSEVPAKCDALGPENKLVFAPGLLSGTPLVNTSRLSIGAKSPLTGTIKESNTGGTVPAALGKLGIAALIIENNPVVKKWFFLVIDRDGAPKFESADRYIGMGTYQLAENIFDVYGKHCGVLCIGSAGERQMLSASIQSTDVDGHPCRAAARGGLGAVMGAKGLKAIIVDLRGRLEKNIVQPVRFEKAAEIFAKAVREHPYSGKELREVGTAGTIEVVNSIGALSSYNATSGVFDKIDEISGETMARIIKQRGGQIGHRGCSQCIINCSNVFVDDKGRYITSSLEFETIWSFGAMTGIADLDVIARLDFMSDDMGIDTMNTGVAFAVAMDAGHRKFGDGQAAIEMMEEIATGTDFGKILGNGPAAVGQHFGHFRIPAVKRQSTAAYDPRAMQGNGVTYATSPMGADHTAGNLLGVYLSGQMDPLKPDGQVEASRRAQIEITLLDTIGLCHFARGSLTNPEIRAAFTEVINAKLGLNNTYDDYLMIGERIIRAELDFNRRAGLTNEDDRLPDFFCTEAIAPHNVAFSVTPENLDDTFRDSREHITIFVKLHGTLSQRSPGYDTSEGIEVRLAAGGDITNLMARLNLTAEDDCYAVIDGRVVVEEFELLDGILVDIFQRVYGG